MDKNITIYRAKKNVAMGGLTVLVLIFLLLILPLIVEGAPVEMGKLLGLGGFCFLGILLIVVPLGGKLEVGEDYIKTYLFGFTTTPEVHRSDIQVLEYGNLMRTGEFGFGKGLKGWRITKSGKNYFSIGENVYGKEAIAHAKRVLEPRS